VVLATKKTRSPREIARCANALGHQRHVELPGRCRAASVDAYLSTKFSRMPGDSRATHSTCANVDVVTAVIRDTIFLGFIQTLATLAPGLRAPGYHGGRLSTVPADERLQQSSRRLTASCRDSDHYLTIKANRRSRLPTPRQETL